MFQKYTEKARKVIFFARYEASQFGSERIETEHLLLGVLREDRALALRLLKAPEKIHSIREQVEKQFPRRDKVSTSVDMPLSHECKRVLKYAAEESERLADSYIAPEHFLLALLREKDCSAAQIMAAHGIASSQLEQARLPVSSEPLSVSPPSGGVRDQTVSDGVRDLTAEARACKLNPLIGRTAELESIIRILSRRTRNNPALIGEPGVGKNALIEGLAQRIADGAVPVNLADRPILVIDAGALALTDLANRPNAILCVHGLFDLARKGAGWGIYLARGAQCIATGTPTGLGLAIERSESLVRLFEVVPVLPPDEEEAIRIVSAVKERYEKFHRVTITKEAVETAVSASRWFLRYRHLPDRAIDLIDDAGASVKLRRSTEPPAVVEIHKRIRALAQEAEQAIVNHEFEKAGRYSGEERKERLNLQRLREDIARNPPINIVNPEDILEAIATRLQVPGTSVRNVVRLKNTEPLEAVAKELAAQFPIGGRQWADALASYLAGCSPEEAEKLAAAIRAAKSRLGAQ
jgi:ATP-dependent Clp protease ATP-binding subunit ClpC